MYIELSSGERGLINCSPLAEQQILFEQVIADDKRDSYLLSNRVIHWYNDAYIHIEWIKRNMVSLNIERPLESAASYNDWRIKMKDWFINFTLSDLSENIGFLLIVVSFGIAGWLIGSIFI
ncbi:hypothetical protein C9J12_27400 [Photobacterium frigidiphilum]|uniref:Uncharacterized protein n=1 Tax=Photobacterium frigidiphilum TaxID=264736 RepID=A0A2T3J6W4_9GAMM|nr:hypothetical protein C9J12_27400 [Photobacterium frigidiphilum]